MQSLIDPDNVSAFYHSASSHQYNQNQSKSVNFTIQVKYQWQQSVKSIPVKLFSSCWYYSFIGLSQIRYLNQTHSQQIPSLPVNFHQGTLMLDQTQSQHCYAIPVCIYASQNQCIKTLLNWIVWWNFTKMMIWYQSI